MSKVLCIIPLIFLTIAFASAYSNYGSYGSYGGGSGYGSSGYGRKRREIPSQQAQQASQPGQQQQQQQFQPVRGPKMFSVNVADGIKGANQLRKEKWDNGTVTGLYANPLGNKKYQIINYIADDKGYRVLSTKVVDETELAQIGGDGKFNPQMGKSAQVDITNDGATASWTVTPDQIAKNKPEARSMKDSADKDSKDKKHDDKDSDEKMGKRSADMDMDMDHDDDSHQGKRSIFGKRSVDSKDGDNEKDKDHKGRRSVDSKDGDNEKDKDHKGKRSYGSYGGYGGYGNPGYGGYGGGYAGRSDIYG